MAHVQPGLSYKNREQPSDAGSVVLLSAGGVTSLLDVGCGWGEPGAFGAMGLFCKERLKSEVVPCRPSRLRWVPEALEAAKRSGELPAGKFKYLGLDIAYQPIEPPG